MDVQTFSGTCFNMQCKLIDTNFISLSINATRAENLFDQFISSISRMSEFGLLIMDITYVVPRPYKIQIEEKKRCILQMYKDMPKVLRYFLGSVYDAYSGRPIYSISLIWDDPNTRLEPLLHTA